MLTTSLVSSNVQFKASIDSIDGGKGRWVDLPVDLPILNSNSRNVQIAILDQLDVQ